MTDVEIITLFFNRDEAAIAHCRTLYGPLLRTVAGRIIGVSDAELAESDAYLDAWNSIPPRKPSSLASYLAMLTRRRAIDMLRSRTRKRRGGAEYEAALEELEECVPSPFTVESEVDSRLLSEALDSFLLELPEKSRIIFMRRYWWLESVSEIARESRMSESAVKMQLKRTREKLRDYLWKEGFDV